MNLRSSLKYPSINLNGFAFHELFEPNALKRLDEIFLAKLAKESPEVHKNLLIYRVNETAFRVQEKSELFQCATFLESFLATFFDIEEAVSITQAKTTAFNPISSFKKIFCVTSC